MVGICQVFSKVYQNPIVIQLTAFAKYDTKKTHICKCPFPNVYIVNCLLYCTVYTHVMYFTYDSVFGLTEKVSTSNRKMKWKVIRILGRNFLQNNNAHLFTFICEYALMAPITKKTIYTHNSIYRILFFEFEVFSNKFTIFKCEIVQHFCWQNTTVQR